MYKIIYSKKAIKGLEKTKISKKEILNLIKRFIQKYKYNEDINIDVESMSTMDSCFRIKKGRKIRIIIKVDPDNKIIDILAVDFRENIYKK